MAVIREVMQSDAGAILVSILLGMGLAALFQRACSGASCVVLRAPNPNEVAKHVYKVQEDCYKYTPYVALCDGNAVKE